MSYDFEYTYLTEKDSQVQALAEVLKAKYVAKFKPAYNLEDKIALVPLKGHVLTGKEPQEYDAKLGEYGEDSIYVFPQKYELKPGKYTKDVLDTAVDHLKRSKRIIIATDFDNEGASIAMNVIRYAGVEDRVERMLPMGSTHPDELRHAIDNPIDIPYLTMADAGMARAFIDWAEGMTLSRALSYYLGDKNKVKLNFGGVKTPLIYMVVERQLAFNSHEKSYYWTVTGNLDFNGTVFQARLKRLTEVEEKGKTKTVWEDKFDSESQAKEAIEYLKNKQLEVGSVSRKKSKSSPPKLYELAGLQGDMTKKFGIKPSGTMDIAQKLYDFPVSLETYPRTDVPYLKESEYVDVKPILTKILEAGIVKEGLIENILAGKIPKRTTTFNDKEVVAHGAIVPTLKGDIKKWYPKLEKLEKEAFLFVVNRYVANFMQDYEYISVSGETKEDNGYKFFFGENIPVAAGWKEIYESDIHTKIKEYKSLIPEDLKTGSTVTMEKIETSRNETKPKPLFTMDTLLKAMEKVASLFPDNKEIKEYLGESGIGTNATRASIIDQVMDNESNKGEPWLIEDSKKIIGTKKAIEFIQVMPMQLVSPIKRALLSKKLRLVEQGKLNANDLIDEYREEMKKNIELIISIYKEKGAIAATAKTEALSVGACPVCGKDVIEKDKIYLCSGAKFNKDEATGEWSNSGCDYKIFKTALNRFGKAKLTAREVSNMLTKGEASVSLKSKKTNKAYTAKIVPDKQWGLKVEFDFK